jgi:hypothetical protein
VQIDPLRVTGNGALDNVETKLEHGPIRVSGPVRARGTQIALENGSAVVGDQTIAISATYDLESGAIAASYDTANSQLGALIAALSGRSEVDGTLTSQGQLTASSPDVNALAGTGRIDIRPGRIQGFSLMIVDGPLRLSVSRRGDRQGPLALRRRAGTVRYRSPRPRRPRTELAYRTRPRSCMARSGSSIARSTSRAGSC